MSNYVAYRDEIYPPTVKEGGQSRWIVPLVKRYCIGRGLDVGAGESPIPGSVPIDIINGRDAMDLPSGPWDYIFSSHCLEHLPDWVAAIEHWRDNIKPSGTLFLYLPHPEMEYWRPWHNRKHRHMLYPKDVKRCMEDLGFAPVFASERDLAWSFSVVGWKQ